jgi:hypothetical protein
MEASFRTSIHDIFFSIFINIKHQFEDSQSLESPTDLFLSIFHSSSDSLSVKHWTIMAQPLSLTCRQKANTSAIKTLLLSESRSIRTQLQQQRQSVVFGQRISRPLSQYSRRTTSVVPSQLQCRSTTTTTTSTSPLPYRCYYHSRFHPRPPTHEYTNSQTAILSAALEHIPEHGFTKEALTLGARDVGFLDVSVQLFTRQEMDLVLFWLASRRGLLRAQVEKGLLEKKRTEDDGARELSVDEKVKILVLERLRMNEKIVRRWQDVSFQKTKIPFPFDIVC